MNQDVILKVKDSCGSHCVGIEEGEKVFDRIEEAFKSGRKICLNFEGVLTITSSFLNASVGRLLAYFKEEDVEENLIWSGLDRRDEELIRLVISNAKEHFAKTKPEQQVENDIVERNIFEKDQNGQF
jgi:hypothetical protein